jgi:voltage-gated potassium channel
MEKRIERKSLRPRDAAYLIGAFWAIAVVVFGALERIVDPKTFHSVWLGMWWAVETVTTVGYGDIVPDQTVGKVIAGFLMLGGLSLLAVVTAAVTSGFVSRAQGRGQQQKNCGPSGANSTSAARPTARTPRRTDPPAAGATTRVLRL